MIDVVWDMETQDPDDFLTLLLLLGHPDVNLKAVTVTPGSADQVGLIRRALGWFDRDLSVGAHNLDHPRPCVSLWHYKVYGQVPPSREAEPGGRCCCVTVTRTPPCSPAPRSRTSERHCDSPATRGPLSGWAAGLRRVALPVRALSRAAQLEQFKGRATCPTFNLNGDPKSALAALQFPGIGSRRFVSKNVCHGVFYDRRCTVVSRQSRTEAGRWG